ncbi:uncharacterized protein LOC110718219 [Chenopodium quinoa]|uniref:uncharacterized protein LOC110718219 n=1 Tax=Chenopodium quinoa TaxID=63459 RepID=UPI000B78D892|nr:uncharacterized protein LOC110718219 [Chenopodium quinoa]
MGQYDLGKRRRDCNEDNRLDILVQQPIIFFLDRLNLDPYDWDVYPRLKVWSMERIGYAGKLDRNISGDYGKIGLLDVAYGERHPKVARDTLGPKESPMFDEVSQLLYSTSRDRRRRSDLFALRWGTKKVNEETSTQVWNGESSSA